VINLRIFNKIESVEYIRKLKLNAFPERLFKKGDEKDLISFLDAHPVKYYAIRDKTKMNSSKFTLNATKEEVLILCKEMEKYTVNISSHNYRDNQVIVGEIQIKPDEQLYLIASSNPNHSLRDAYQEPTYNMVTYLNDAKLKKIDGLNIIIEYIINHNLQDIIVEFSVFNVPIGINKEPVIIWELRTEY